MVRERMVTRTCTEKVCTAMCMNITTAEVVTREFIIPAQVKSGKEIDVIRQEHDTTDFKVVAVTQIVTKEVLYGMTEEEFKAHAKVLPPRTTSTEE